MLSSAGTENTKYRLLGFESRKGLAVVMVISTGKVFKIKLSELLASEVLDDLNKAEMKDVYRKFYSKGTASTIYEVSDRHERSWMIFVILNLALITLYIFSNFSATKPVYISWFDVVVTPGVFLYPLTFLIVDMLNEFYGLKLARNAIFFVLTSNALITVLLSASTYLPKLPGWSLDEPYNEVITHVSSALIASSVAFFCSEYANSYLLCKIKTLTNSQFLFLRVFFSTLFAVILDSFIFCFIAFYGAMKNEEILGIVYVQIVIKMGFAFFNVLPAYGARALFRRYVVGTQAA
ncbi:queuosine precursor transporter [Pseudomonas sp. RGM2987]|uniref:queuosine precursor transporter n=1 Tax=Pseudomonas sp. RGM2987 TaxID=2930090 RepID=UPI001FD6415A|nr:queuosine precursor transporter [Pseudomonas sp. RGM2987]MCJ8206070.1 queuosine precursor transporter [Pseudomonas sp. RGM2987]